MTLETTAFTYEGKQYTAHRLVCSSSGVQELADTIKARRTAPGWTDVSAHALGALQSGDMSNVAKADALLDQIETPDIMAQGTPSTVRAIAGGVADVPAYLAGAPVNMRQRRRRETLAPITIMVDVGTSGAVSGDQIQRRGVATLALVRKLISAGYPVELFAGFCAVGSYNRADTPGMVAVRIDTAPLDLARACWTLSNEAFQRQVLFQTLYAVQGKSYAGSVLWPWNAANWRTTPAMQQAGWASALRVDPTSLLVIPPGHSDESTRFASTAATVGWINEKYAEAVALVA